MDIRQIHRLGAKIARQRMGRNHIQPARPQVEHPVMMGDHGVAVKEQVQAAERVHVHTAAMVGPRMVQTHPADHQQAGFQRLQQGGGARISGRFL